MAAFAPRLDILPPAQRWLWDEFSAIPSEFVLYGGTAIALHLGHRQSLDFDFFGTSAFDPLELRARIPLLRAATVTQQAANTLTVTIENGEPVKVSFFGLPNFPCLSSPSVAPDNRLRIASLLDLAGTKVAVVQQRAETRDYIDIDAIVRIGGIDLPTALASAAAIYGDQFNPQITLKALSYFADLTELTDAVRARLATAAREVDLDHLPDIASRSEKR